MRVVDIIGKKRDKESLTKEEIQFLLSEYLKENIPDYQMSAYLMAVYFNGMTDTELKNLTEEMINSGDTLNLKLSNHFVMDKHSTGGVGDKTTISLLGLLPSLGINIGKLSGKGLGHTGGTIDKLKSIPNFKFSLSEEELVEKIRYSGSGLMEGTKNLVPLDKRLYALRDVTGTVASIPLIASSIMSKKLAMITDGIILDVKVGSGAFMKDIESARLLAETMIKLGEGFGRKVAVLLTNMEEPLGLAVGNSNEVIEAIEALKGRGPKDYTDLLIAIGGVALKLKGEAKTQEEGEEKTREVINSGKALENLRKFIKISGGDENIIDNYSLLPHSKFKLDVLSEKEGYIQGIEAEKIGLASMMLGAGRATKEDKIDLGVGVILSKKTGDYVKKGEKLATLEYNKDENLNDSKHLILSGYLIGENQKHKKKIIYEIL